jgi:PAS domain S-box-containing protein
MTSDRIDTGTPLDLALFRAAVEHGPMSVLITGADGTIRYLNANFEKRTGFTRTELLGTKIRDVHPAQTASLDQLWDTVSSGKSWRGEIPGVSKAGKENWVLAHAWPVKSASGEIDYVVCAGVEVTGHRNAEEALSASEERYRILYQDNPTMYFTVDVTGTVLSVNQFGAEQLGFTVEELLGSPVLDVFHPDDKRNVLSQLRACIETPGEVAHWEFRKVKKDGETIWVKEAARATRGAGGELIVLIVCEDITERRRMEEELQAAREELESKVEMVLEQTNPYDLTFRQLTVLHLVAQGRSDREIGLALGISPLTVNTHVSRTLKKMGASSRTEAGVRALREGLIR